MAKALLIAVAGLIGFAVFGFTYNLRLFKALAFTGHSRATLAAAHHQIPDPVRMVFAYPSETQADFAIRIDHSFAMNLRFLRGPESWRRNPVIHVGSNFRLPGLAQHVFTVNAVGKFISLCP